MADWPQWRGPNRNGISAETGLLSSFPAGGPRKLWSANVGSGFSTAAISKGRAFTLGNYQEQDFVSCLNALTGKIIWAYKYPQGAGDYSGPRATPTINADKVYTFSREGLALCLDAGTGKVLWQKNIAQEIRSSAPRWGYAGSPLIVGNLVIYNVGTGGAALDKNTGRTVWTSGGEVSGYASPVAFTAGSKSGVAIFGKDSLKAVEPGSGRILWQYPWQTAYDVNAADPIFSGDSVFISSNYGKGGSVLRITGGKPTPVWENRSMKNHFNSCVLVGGTLYGNDENTLRGIDFATGAERWSMRGMDKGGLIAADGKLIALTGRGELTLIRAVPSAFTEIGRAKILSGDCWAHPVLANGLLYCRNHEGNLICLDMRRS
jgi:outer membrane protein assembly factor BamB